MSSVASRAVRKTIGTLERSPAQAPGDLEAVDVGEHDVEHDQGRAETTASLPGLATPCVRDVGLEALVAQRHARQLGDARLVVDDQDAERLGQGVLLHETDSLYARFL